MVKIENLEAGNYVRLRNADDVEVTGRLSQITESGDYIWYTVMFSPGNLRLLTGDELEKVLVDFW